MRLFFILFIVLFFTETTFGQDSITSISKKQVQYDTDSNKSPIEFDKNLLEKYKNDDDFDYTPPEKSENWWSRFLDWLSDIWTGFWNWIASVWRSFWRAILGDAEGSMIWGFVINILPYIILVLLIVFIIWLFYKLNPGARLMQSKATPDVFFSEEEEIIKKRDINALIQQALQDSNYRLAVRYHYLLSLQKLSEAELIEYEFDKTNSDYFKEIASEVINKNFKKATLLYDYIWYGNFSVSEEDYKKAESTFTNLDQTITVS